MPTTARSGSCSHRSCEWSRVPVIQMTRRDVLRCRDCLNTPTKRPAGFTVSTFNTTLSDDPCAVIRIGHGISFADGIQVYSNSFVGCIDDPHVISCAEI